MDDLHLLARKFINTTGRHIFLTGKAGTGKTTFLKNLPSITRKNFIVVAPTGIAALNAGGVTIHSQFLLPFGMFVPDRNAGLSDSSEYYTQQTLARKHPLSQNRREVLRSIDLLVIDEVSMLRADLLDAIDYRLRSVRGNFHRSFGGVQVLFIGDLFQLAPVVKREDEERLRRYYPTPWFYEAHALQGWPPVVIELDKIYRQQDQDFISVLNNLRNNVVTPRDIDILNERYRSPEEIATMGEIVTLTTHNYKADEINSKMLRALTTPSSYFEATVEKDFPENLFPLPQRLELKVGAQVMFVRNDGEGEYYNGKLGTITEITKEGVWLEMAGTKSRYKLKRERWENKKYLMDENQELNEEVVGSFEQYPIKLAWAITVHKSQGLTFEKAIIDVAQAFADGQVYVAFSRLRSIDGLVLSSRINPAAIRTDKNVISFVETRQQQGDFDAVVQSEQRAFLRESLSKTFDFEGLSKDLRFVIRDYDEGLFSDVVAKVLGGLAASLESEMSNTEKFRRQLASLVDTDRPMLDERLAKGVTYYRGFLVERLKTLLRHQEEMKRQKKVKTYLGKLAELDLVFTNKLKQIDSAVFVVANILDGKEELVGETISKKIQEEKESIVKEILETMPELPKKKKKGKRKKGDPDTVSQSVSLLKEGKTISEIADHRGLVISTIEGHLARAVSSGDISLSDFVPDSAVEEVIAAARSIGENVTLPGLVSHFKGKYSYNVLRVILDRKRIVPDTDRPVTTETH